MVERAPLTTVVIEWTPQSFMAQRRKLSRLVGGALHGDYSKEIGVTGMLIGAPLLVLFFCQRQFSFTVPKVFEFLSILFVCLGFVFLSAWKKAKGRYLSDFRKLDPAVTTFDIYEDLIQSRSSVHRAELRRQSSVKVRRYSDGFCIREDSQLVMFIPTQTLKSEKISEIEQALAKFSSGHVDGADTHRDSDAADDPAWIKIVVDASYLKGLQTALRSQRRLTSKAVFGWVFMMLVAAYLILDSVQTRRELWAILYIVIAVGINFAFVSYYYVPTSKLRRSMKKVRSFAIKFNDEGIWLGFGDRKALLGGTNLNGARKFKDGYLLQLGISYFWIPLDRLPAADAVATAERVLRLKCGYFLDLT